MNDAQRIAAIVGITEAIKQFGIPSKFCPTIAIIVGALFSYAENPTSEGILKGIVWGATITGGYAVIKRSGQGLLSPFKSSKNPFADLEPEDDRGI